MLTFGATALRLFLTAMMIVEKMNNDYIAKKSLEMFSILGGVNKQLLNKLEVEFLTMIEFRTFVSEEIYNKYYNLISQFNN